ncbi:MAG: hypothetical protein IJO80_01430 [Firmicutes bacterium]|nr:hypothetical protein [Bacillota bacterium]MBQ6841861.1 hypothetical protein [Bacillota bacterium]
MKLISDHPLPALLLMLAAVLLLSVFTLPLLAAPHTDADAAEYPLAAATSLQRVLIYADCGHRSSREISAEPFRSLSAEGLLAVGWQLDMAGGSASLSEQLEGLCPACSAMLHLRLYQGQLCVFAGPAAAFDGTAQPLLRLSLSPAQLPPELQAELSRGAIEFTDAEQLYSALDSLDEYR